MSGFRNDRQRHHARALRQAMTPAERLLWQHLRAHRFMGLSVRRQAPVGPFIVGFLIPAHRLVIEAAGGPHAGPDRDDARDAFLRARGCRVLRFWNSEITGDLPGVLARIAEAVR